MQLKDQLKQPRNWKVVGTMAVSAALGVSGLALAVPGGSNDVDSINLQDSANLDQVTSTTAVPSTEALIFEDLASPLQVQPPSTTRAGGRDFDSPFDTASPNTTSPASPASPATPSPQSPATPSPDSPASPDSPRSPASPDSGSADSGSADSFG